MPVEDLEELEKQEIALEQAAILQQQQEERWQQAQLAQQTRQPQSIIIQQTPGVSTQTAEEPQKSGGIPKPLITFLVIALAIIVVAILIAVISIIFEEILKNYSPSDFSNPSEIIGETNPIMIASGNSSGTSSTISLMSVPILFPITSSALCYDSSYIGSVQSAGNIGGSSGDSVNFSVDTLPDISKFMTSGSVRLNPNNKILCDAKNKHCKKDKKDDKDDDDNNNSSNFQNFKDTFDNKDEYDSLVHNYHDRKSNYNKMDKIEKRHRNAYHKDHILDKIRDKRKKYLYENEGYNDLSHLISPSIGNTFKNLKEGYYDLRDRYLYTLDKPHKGGFYRTTNGKW